ncbi:hypothetical protein ID866_9051 [Astraeus odoratus]|nr:hypothetical protein ID866_9051 [Astraeus odoratus]
MPASTIRAYVMGSFWAILIPGLNQFFFFRYPSVTISGFVSLLLALPLGRAWAKVMPKWNIFGLPLNPGPFTIKEHVLVSVMASVAGGCTYLSINFPFRRTDVPNLQLHMLLVVPIGLCPLTFLNSVISME